MRRRTRAPAAATPTVAPPGPPHTPAAPSGGGRSLSGPWCCRSFRLSNQSDLPRLPTPRPYPLHPLHRKWAGPGVLVSACLAPAAFYYLGRGSRSPALGRWLRSQQRREAERAHRSSMSQTGKTHPALAQLSLIPRQPKPPSWPLPPARGLEVKDTGISFNSDSDPPKVSA